MGIKSKILMKNGLCKGVRIEVSMLEWTIMYEALKQFAESKDNHPDDVAEAKRMLLDQSSEVVDADAPSEIVITAKAWDEIPADIKARMIMRLKPQMTITGFVQS